MRLKTVGCVLGCVVSSVAAAAAPDSVSGSETLYLEELPVVLSVSRLAQGLNDAPGSVTVLDAAAIRSSGARDLADLLRMVPGFVAAHSNDGAPKAVYHGMTDPNPRGLQILVDGRSQYSPLFFGGVAWNLIDIPLADIERIEVIRGSNSAAYGSNAFFGIVNIVTLAAIDVQGAQVRLGAGNDGVADRYVRAGTRMGPGYLRVSAESTRDEGVRGFSDDRGNTRFNLRSDLPLSSADEFSLQLGLVTMGLDAGTPGDLRDKPREKTARKEFVALAWRHAASDGGGVELRASQSREHYRDAFIAHDPRLDLLAAGVGLPSPYPVLIDQDIDTERDEVEFQHTLVPASSLRFVWGGGLRNDRVHAVQFYSTDATLRQDVARIFGNMEWRPDSRWTANIGATWEDDSLSGSSLAPRLALNYHLTPNQTLRAGVSHAHRLPSLTEEKARTAYGSFDTRYLGRSAGVLPVEITRRATGGLRQEFLQAQELAYLGDFRAQRMFVDVRVFREHVHDQIVPVTVALPPSDCELLGVLAGRCGQAVDFVNGHDLKIRGLEYQVRWEPWNRAELTLNQSFTAIDVVDNADLMRRDAVAAIAVKRHMDHSAPRVATMLRWRQRFAGGLEASLIHYRYGAYQWTADSEVKPSLRTDVRVAHPLAVGARRGEVALVVQGVGPERAEYCSGPVGGGTACQQGQRLGPRGWLSVSFDL